MLFGGFESINCCRFSGHISINFGSILTSEAVHASRGLRIASRLLQVGLLEPIWAQLGSKLVPSWLKLGPCWPCLKLGLCWAHFRVPSHPWANPSPSRPLPCCLLASQTPTRPKMAKSTPKGLPKPPTWTLKPQLGAQNPPK